MLEKLLKILDTMESWITEFPPVDQADQRFGNKAFRDWFEKLKQVLRTRWVSFHFAAGFLLHLKKDCMIQTSWTVSIDMAINDTHMS